MESNRVFAGVDISGGRKRMTLAVLSRRLEILALQELLPEQAPERLAAYPELTVAIGGPLRPNRAGRAGESAREGEPRRADRRRARSAEKELARRGIPVRKTPDEESAAPAWMRSGFRLARELAGIGFAEGRRGVESPRIMLETRPPACASVLLGRVPFGRETLEGRIQRQLALLRERVVLPDPMESLEEITAHHLLSGRLALDGILRADELDALLAAFAAWRASGAPDSVVWLGDDSDGWICLPAKELLEKYAK